MLTVGAAGRTEAKLSPEDAFKRVSEGGGSVACTAPGPEEKPTYVSKTLFKGLDLPIDDGHAGPHPRVGMAAPGAPAATPLGRHSSPADGLPRLPDPGGGALDGRGRTAGLAGQGPAGVSSSGQSGGKAQYLQHLGNHQALSPLSRHRPNVSCACSTRYTFGHFFPRRKEKHQNECPPKLDAPGQSSH